ncbi:hypothetical protein BH11MYX4_BH11MYX4_42590 [soil metagenome]
MTALTSRARVVWGSGLILGMLGLLGGALALARAMYRDRSGLSDAEAGFAVILPRIEAAYARDGRMCGSSLVEETHPFSWLAYATTDRSPTIEAERLANVGFACLALEPHAIPSGLDGYTYELTGDAFVVRAFRAPLYDPEGRLPRFERRGRIEGGKLVVDRRVYRVDPGGPRFPGHMREYGASY